MKKILICLVCLTSSLLFGITKKELVDRYDSSKVSGYDQGMKWAKDNSADIEELLPIWLESDYGKWISFSLNKITGWDQLPKEDRLIEFKFRHLVSLYFCIPENFKKLDSQPDSIKLNIRSYFYNKVHRELWDVIFPLKNINGVDIKPRELYLIAKSFGSDKILNDFVNSLTIDEVLSLNDYKLLSIFVNNKISIWYTSDNIKKSYEDALSIENRLKIFNLNKNDPQINVLIKKIQDAEDSLYINLTRKLKIN